jgi:hypothetical protein
MQRREEVRTPNFHEDPAFYKEDIVGYIEMLERFNPVALSSARKPSLSDYDLHEEFDEDEEVKESYRWRRLQ